VRDPAERPTGPFAELLAHDGVEEDLVLRSTFGFLAFHGGSLEEMTDVVAATAAAEGGASYYGVRQPEDLQWHLPSVEVDPAQSSRLRAFLDHVDVVIAVHGYGREGRWTELLAGGTNRALAAAVGRALEPRLRDYTVITDLDAIPRELRGLHARNPVNLPAAGGVQLKLPPRVRGRSPLSPPPGPDGLSPPTAALIDGLAEVGRSWVAAPTDSAAARRGDAELRTRRRGP
jgi:phage replication-related protein YjqB (UPF0714/DUF867 family)